MLSDKLNSALRQLISQSSMIDSKIARGSKPGRSEVKLVG